MKKLVLCFLLLSLVQSLYAQDLIVTMEGDSINCRITKIKPDYIYFNLRQQDEIMKTLIASDQVSYFEKGYYTNKGVPSDLPPIPSADYPRFRIALNGGWSYRIGKLPDGISPAAKQYLQELKSGNGFGGDILYYFSETMGLGFKYGLHRSTNSVENIYFTDENGNTRYGKLKDDISISFYGPTFSARTLNSSNESTFLTNISLGYMDYINKSIVIDPMTFTGGSVGMVWDIGYDVGISENFSLGIQLSYFMGTLSKYEITKGTTKTTQKLAQDQYESLNRIELLIGLRFIQ